MMVNWAVSERFSDPGAFPPRRGGLSGRSLGAAGSDHQPGFQPLPPGDIMFEKLDADPAGCR